MLGSMIEKLGSFLAWLKLSKNSIVILGTNKTSPKFVAAHFIVF